MQPHQQRVVDEKKELDAKIADLHRFVTVPGAIFGSLPEAERFRLFAQHRAMSEYSAILGERIACF